MFFSFLPVIYLDGFERSQISQRFIKRTVQKIIFGGNQIVCISATDKYS
ncbi:hypothetical protein X975_08042, partial [Stegodyphus mimosarum]